MFPPQRYTTAAVDRELPLAVQLFLWQCIGALPFSPDYLQVFQLSTEGCRLKIVPGLPQRISVTVGRTYYGEDLRDQR